MSMSFSGQTAIVGIGATEFSKRSGRSTLRLAVECSEAAIADAGLTPRDETGAWFTSRRPPGARFRICASFRIGRKAPRGLRTMRTAGRESRLCHDCAVTDEGEGGELTDCDVIVMELNSTR